MRVASLLCVLLLLPGCGGATAVTADQLIAEFDKDMAKAKAAYKGRTLVVTGMVLDLNREPGLDLNGLPKPLIVVFGSGKGSLVECYFATPPPASVVAGSKVAIRCRFNDAYKLRPSSSSCHIQCDGSVVE